MSAIVKLDPPKSLPDDCAQVLRELADRVDRNEIKSLAVAYEAEQYSFIWPSSYRDSLVLAAMMNALALDRIRA